MTSRLNPYLSFTDNARQALEFYNGVFDGTLELSTFGDFGTEMADASYSDRIMHGHLETESGLTLMAADAPPDHKHQPGNNIAMSLSGDDAAELRGYWDKLSDGGTVSIPMEKQMWGDEFGMCVDRFGIAWMVNISQSES